MSPSARTIFKARRRVLLVAANSLNSLLLPLFSVLISLWVVRLASVELWGAFVATMIVAQLGAHVLAWGNKEYLLRAFSREPAHVVGEWRRILVTRLTLFPLFVLIVLLFGWPPVQTLLVILWTLGIALSQSFEVLIVYRRAFVASIAIELGAIAILLAAVTLIGAALTLDALLLTFAGVTLGKAALLALAFRAESFGETTDPGSGQDLFAFAYFGAALPFFLLGLTGMLQSRIDLYAVNHYLPEQEVGQYQIYINLLIYVQALANFVLLPFAKSLYRLERSASSRVSLRLLILGLLLVVPALAAIYWLLAWGYAIELTSLLLLLGALYVLPVYYYLPTVYALYRADRQRVVFWVNACGVALSLVLSILLVPRYAMTGALLATTLVQWFVLVCYVAVQVRDRDTRSLASALP